MASAPQPNMPLFYRELTPLSSNEHAGWRARQMADLSMFENTHAIPLTTDEFFVAQRFHPIVFTQGDEPVPLALFGLNEGVNVFINEQKMLGEDAYLPAFARRYPWMLVRLQPDTEELSLCFDPSCGLLGEFEDGVALFENGEISEPIKQTLGFCEQFEMGVQRSAAFVAELKQLGLMTDGEITIQPADSPDPFIYRGFQIVNEEKLRELRGDQLRKMMQSGMLPLIHAHLMSLQLMPILFDRQVRVGKGPAPQPSAG